MAITSYTSSQILTEQASNNWFVYIDGARYQLLVVNVIKLQK